MRVDAKPEPDGGWERDGLRKTLQRWTAPAPPAELENALRREFRRRRPRRQPGAWLSLAAVLGLLAAWPIVAARLKGRPAAPVHSASATVPAAPIAEPTAPPMPVPSRLEPAAPRISSAVAGRRVATSRSPEPAVVVEPGQAELLAEFGRAAWQKTQVAPGASMPAMPAAATPAFRAEWRELAGEWPAVHVAVSSSGR